MAFARFQATIANAVGQALAGIEVFVCTQPASTGSIPPSPLASLYAAPTSNNVAVNAASWELGILELTLASIPADLVVGSYIAVTGANPSGYNGIYQVQAIDGLVVSLLLPTDPGTYVGSASVATSALPNPIFSDGLGNFFFYANPGTYTIVYYDPAGILQPPIQVFPDQAVVTPGGGVVNTVTLTMPGEFSVAQSGTTDVVLAVTKVNQNANKVYAGPSSGADAAPTFRQLVLADLPSALGTVTSVAITCEVPADASAAVTGSPVSTAGTIDIEITDNNQAANTVKAGPASGASATPGYRALVIADIPGAPLQKAVVTLATADILALLGTPITLVPAQGTNTLIVPIATLIEVEGGSAAFTDAGGAVELVIGGAVFQLASNAVFTNPLSQKQNQYVGAFAATGAAAATPSDVNAPMQIKKITNNFAAGNGSAQITVLFAVVAFA